MPTKFEKLLDYLINEETEKANELFHEIVVEKSRKIYENLIAQEASDEEMDETMDSHMQDDMFDGMSHSGMEDESVYELAGDEDEFGDADGDPADEFVDSVIDKDAMDMDMEDEVGDMDMEDEMESDVASKEDVMDIKDALEALKAEFAALVSKETDDMDMDMDMDMEDDEADDDDMDMEDDMDDEDMDMEDDEDEDEDMEEAFIREYREIIEKNPLKGSTKEQGVNSHSPINANPKNRPSGGNVSAGNIAQGGEEGKVTTAKAKGEFVPKGTMNVGGTQTKGYKDTTKKPAGEPSGLNSKSVVPK